MFRFANAGKVWVPVVLPMGNTEGGGEVVIHLLQDLFTRDEMRSRERDVRSRSVNGLSSRAGEIKTLEDLERVFDEVVATEKSDTDDLVRRTHDWRGIVDDEGQAIPFDTEKLAALATFDWWFKAARAALFETSREGVRKNLLPGPDGLPTPVQA